MDLQRHGQRSLKRALTILVSALFAFVTVSTVSAMTPAGTVIENQAQLVYIDDNGRPVNGISGLAIVTVAPLAGTGLPAEYVIRKESVPPCGVSIGLADPIRYELAFENTGGRPEALTEVTLADGRVVQGVLLIDPVPSNTDLVVGSVEAGPADAIAVLHPTAEDLGTWVEADDWDGTLPIDRVGLLVPEALAVPGQVSTLAFSVVLEEGVQNGTPIFNSAGVDADGDGVLDFTSPQVCNFVDAPGELPDPEIRFLQPSDLVFLGDGFPEIAVDEDWAESEFYQLNPNDLLIQGVWLQLDATQLNLSALDVDFVETGSDAVAGAAAAETLTKATAGSDGDAVSAAATLTGRLLQVTLSAVGTGDEVLVTLRETGPNTGDFRSVYPVYLSENPIPGVTDADVACPAAATMDSLVEYTPETDVEEAVGQGCALNAIREDSLRVSFDVPVYGPNGVVTRLQAVEDIAAVDPAGTVFDSFTGEPVGGAVVRLLQSEQPLADTGFDSCAELPLDRYIPALDPFTGEVQPVEITDAINDDNDPDIGDYAYPFATPFHCYRLDVEPPDGYRFPSVVPPEELAQFSDIVSEPSYGAGGFAGGPGFPGAFLLELENLFFDIPLDTDRHTLPTNPLRLSKSVDRAEAGIAEVVVYTIDIENPLDQSVGALRIDDRMPFGFRFVEGTARLVIDGETRDVAVRVDGTRLDFDLGAVRIGPGSTASVSYALRLSAGAVDGDGVNSAQAFAETEFRTPVSSNVDRVQVRVEDSGVLSSRAIIFGKVYVDQDCNDVQNDGEWPVGGVRLYMEDGSWVVTDENGQYSMFDVEPGNRVIRIDGETLPEGLELKLIDTRQAGSPDSRFVDLRGGEMHRADFAAFCPETNADAVYELLAARNASLDGSWRLDEAERFDPRREQAAPRQVIDSDGAISDNRIGGAELTALPTAAVASTRSNSAAGREMPLPIEAAAGVTKEDGRAGTWLWPTNGRSDDGRFLVAVRAGVAPTLFVNDVEVPGSQLGEQVLNGDSSVQVLAFYGVELAPGENRLEVRGLDPFGNLRVLAEGVFVRAGSATRLELVPEADELAADGGASMLAITVRLLDARGNVARGTDFVTLDVSEGSWLEEDLQTSTPGHQIRVENGEAVVHLRSGDGTGRARLTASNGALEDAVDIAFVAPLRPLFVTGIASVEARFGSDTDDDGRAPTGDLDVGDDGVDDRVALFMKGRVRGDAHLTLSYDSDQNTNDEALLRDIRPDGGFYPIPGDAAARGFEAQSRSPLYAKLEKDRHSALWGDFVTDASGDSSDLGRVQKTLTGGNAVYDDGTTRVQLFGAEADEARVSEEFRGNGTALGYQLRADIVRHSEVVELRVRDRDNPGLVIESTPLSRFEDYTIDYLTGRLQFVRSIPSLNDDLNFVSVFITYDVTGQGEEYEVAGGRIEHAVNDELTVTAAHTYDGNRTEGSELSGVGLRYDGEQTRVAVSVATMQSRADGERGEGYRVEVERDWDGGARTRALYGRGEAGFRNASGGVSENRQELRFEHTQKLLERMDLRLTGSHSERLDTDDAQTAIEAAAVIDVAGVKVIAGGRAIEQRSEAGTDRFNTAEVGVRHADTIAGRPVDVGAEYEQALDGSERRRAALDLEVALLDTVSAYGTYELIDSLQGAAAASNDEERSNFVFGVRANMLANTETYSEYRLRGTNDGRNEVAAQGVRGSYELVEGLAIQPAVERIDTISGPSGDDGLSLSVGLVDERDPNARKRLRLETRLGDERDFHGLSGSWVARMNEDWSVSLREELRWDVEAGARDAINHIMTVGLARRPRRDNDHHILLLYQWEEDRTANGVDRSIHLFSTHQNLELSESLLLSGRLGAKFAETEVNGVNVNTDAVVLDARLIFELTNRIDLDLHGGVLATEGFDEVRYAAGIGAGFLVREDLRLTAGYNLVGFDDEDLDEEGFLAEGFYAGLQFKFDEDSFRWLEGARP